MSEQKVQTKILKWLEKERFYAIKTIITNKKGVPDILACSPKGKFVAIEVKYGKNVASRLQEHNMKQIRDRNGFAMVCWDLDSLIFALRATGVHNG